MKASESPPPSVKGCNWTLLWLQELQSNRGTFYILSVCDRGTPSEMEYTIEVYLGFQRSKECQSVSSL